MDSCCQFHAHTVTAERTLEGLDAVDALIIKAAKVGLVSQIARIEMKLRDYMYKKWQQRALRAEKAALAAYKRGGTAEQIGKAADKIMSGWADEVARRYMADVDAVYRLAREAGFEKAAGRLKGSLGYDTDNFQSIAVKKAASIPADIKASFDLVDEAAVTAIQEDQLFWIGEHYDTHVAGAIRDEAKGMIESGVGRTAGGKAMGARIRDALSHVKTPAGFRGSQAQYMEGLVANAVTTARTQGQIRSFVELGVTTYEIVNPSDRRTCLVCQHMNGKVFTVDQGTKQMEADMEAKTPDDRRNSHPWIKRSELKAISPKSGHVSAADSKKLADHGQALPPYHFRCRCTVDITDVAPSTFMLPPETAAAPTSALPKAKPAMLTPRTPRLPKVKPKTPGPKVYKDTSAWAGSLTEEQRAVFKSWSYEDYTIMRQVDIGKPNKIWTKKAVEKARKNLNSMRSSLRSAPEHKGTVYRGITIDSEAAKPVLKKGAIIQQEAISSWTASEEASMNFAVPNDWEDLVADAADEGKKLMFMRFEAKITKPRSAFSIADDRLVQYAEEEAEVLVEKGAKFSVKATVPVDTSGKEVAAGSAKHAGWIVKMEQK